MESLTTSSLNAYIKFTLNIENQNIIFSNYSNKNINGKIYKIYLAELIQPVCPYCRSTNLKHNVRLITADASKPVTIRLSKQRVLCNDCLKRSMAPSNLINKGCYISTTSKPKILSALTEDHSMTGIAREHNVSVNTIQRVLESCSFKFYYDFDRLLQHLAFDEFKGVGKKLHFICLDGDTHKVIDPFHMAPLLTRSFNVLRVQIMKKFNKHSREYKLLKSPWKLYLMKYDKLHKTTPYYDWHFKDCLTPAHVGLDCDQTLENTYGVM